MFRTELTIAPATGQLPRSARVVTVGSCFADSIGSRLAANKVETLVNPFGTVFQPLALARLLRAAAGEEVDWQQHLVEARGRWQSYDLHGSIGADSPVELLQTIQELVRHTGEFLRQADVVLLTLGTAWAYRLRETGELVNNCHKQSADLFVRELLTPDEIINGLAETHAYLRRINPELRFVLTVSPVRHLKDTLQLNSVSKSVLRLATHIVSDLLPGVAYFPAYELLVDDLRDYRFYAADMLHPSEVAEDYVWEKFARAYFDADFGRFRKEWAAVRQSLGHRPLHAGAPEHRQFLESTREKLEQLSLRKVDVAEELRTVRTQLAALPTPRLPEPVVVPEDDEERIDIGEGTASAVAPVAMPTEATPTPITEGRPPRLSPEEFRAQRAARSGRPDQGRRDGRGKGQQTLPSENEQFQAAATGYDEQTSIPLAADSKESTNAPEQLIRPAELTSALEALDSDLEADLAGEELGKKKKRRSRGGAKRTARKNALRLAADGLLPAIEPGFTPDDTDDATTPAAAQDTPDLRVEGQKSTVITKSIPVKRGGRRDESGRVPRAALFAPSPAPISVETPQTTEALAIPAAPVPITEPNTQVARDTNVNSRNDRNRNNRGRAKADVLDSAATAVEPTANIPALPTFSNATADVVVPTLVQSTEANAETPAAPVAARQPRRKARAVSAARSEKPAIDTPVIPVPDDSVVRTQVAAGRMTGSSASLVAPTAQPKAAVLSKKAATPAKAATKAVAKTIEPATVVPAAPVPAPVKPLPPIPSAKPAVASKPKAAAKPPTPKTAAIKAPAVVASKAAPAKAITKPAIEAVTALKKAAAKPAATPKTVAPKVAVPAKSKAEPAASTPTAAVKAEPASKAAPKKKPTAKPAAKPAAAKPKPPKKPTKPA